MFLISTEVPSYITQITSKTNKRHTINLLLSPHYVKISPSVATQRNKIHFKYHLCLYSDVMILYDTYRRPVRRSIVAPPADKFPLGFGGGVEMNKVLRPMTMRIGKQENGLEFR